MTTIRSGLALVLPLMACGGTEAAWSEPSEGGETTVSVGAVDPEPGPAPGAPDPWAAVPDPGALREYVAEQALARLREVQPGVDAATVLAWRTDPVGAPELSGRVVERLIDLAAVDLAAGRPEDAVLTIRLIRMKARNRNSAFAGTTFLAIAARRRAGDDAADQEAAIAAVFRELPRPRFGAATVVFQISQTEQQLAAQAAQARQQLLVLETASAALIYEQVLPDVVAGRERYLAAIATVRAENERARPLRDYRFSTVDLAGARDAQPVVIGVIDTGTSPSVYEGQLYTNAQEQPNGQDDDGNGLADDIHGVVADGDAPHTALLFEPAPDVLQQYSPFLRGIMDLRAGQASTDAAQAVLELMRGATDADALERLEMNLDAVGEWAHGTHVAGIMVAGNPHARIAVFRSAWMGESRPYHHRGPTDAELRAEMANMHAIADFVNRHHVRVVNASVGFSRDYVEDALRYEQDRYHDDAAVRARSAVVHAARQAAWQYLFEHCPDTLFVVAAGNANRDVVEYQEWPAAMSQPNLVVVGAVDRYGSWATFTNSNPERVRLFDHGVEVEAPVPSGERTPLSGTSMASPNVANLAGKLFALDPGLTPARAVTILEATADPIAAPFGGRIPNEQRAVARVRRERGR